MVTKKKKTPVSKKTSTKKPVAAKKAPAKKKVVTPKKKKVVKQAKITKTYVAFVLDKSSSMATIWDPTISAFNEQVEKLNEVSKDLDTRISLFTFNDTVERVFFNEPVSKLEKLNRDTYKPTGCTAMYDGVGDTLNALEALKDINDSNVAVLVLVISDGEENSSRRFLQNTVAEKIQALQKTNRWTFTYLGANQDLSVIAARLNIPVLNTQSFSATPMGVVTASATTNNVIGSYYKSVTRGMSNSVDFYSDENKADEGDTPGTVVVSPVNIIINK